MVEADQHDAAAAAAASAAAAAAAAAADAIGMTLPAETLPGVIANRALLEEHGRAVGSALAAAAGW